MFVGFLLAKLHIICYSAIRQGISCDIPGLGFIFPEAIVFLNTKSNCIK
jgi:hypothetical protein